MVCQLNVSYVGMSAEYLSAVCSPPALRSSADGLCVFAVFIVVSLVWFDIFSPTFAAQFLAASVYVCLCMSMRAGVCVSVCLSFHGFYIYLLDY